MEKEKETYFRDQAYGIEGMDKQKEATQLFGVFYGLGLRVKGLEFRV